MELNNISEEQSHTTTVKTEMNETFPGTVDIEIDINHVQEESQSVQFVKSESASLVKDETLEDSRQEFEQYDQKIMPRRSAATAEPSGVDLCPHSELSQHVCHAHPERTRVVYLPQPGEIDKKQCRKLISLYRGYKCLWDSNNHNYTNRRIREDSWRSISREMNDVPITELKKKMESLMGSYRREKSREKQSRITGSGNKDIYKSNWYAYEDFAFMADKNDPGRTRDSLQKDKSNDTEGGSPDRITPPAENEVCNKTSETDNQQTQRNFDHSSPSSDQNQHKRTIKRRKKKSTTDLDEVSDETISEALRLLHQCAQSPQPEKDSYSSFGLYVANELRKYDPMTLAYVKNAICGIIYKADIRTYQQHGDYTNPQPPLPVLSPSSASPMPPQPLLPSHFEPPQKLLSSMSPASLIPLHSQSISDLSNIPPSPLPPQSPPN